MIKRHYFYQADTQTEDSKFYFGVITTQSWFAQPMEITKRIIKDMKEATGATDRQIKIVTLNRL